MTSPFMMFIETECEFVCVCVVFFAITICCRRFTHSSLLSISSCCNWGEGSYQIAFDDNVIATGGSFGESETTTFSTPGLDNSAPDTPNPSTTPPECYDVFVNLSFDQYSQDESWDISQNEVVVASSEPFVAGLTEDAQELCLSPGDYVFTIYDVYGDGMCCDWGDGSYSVTTNDEVTIAEGGEFGPSESTLFTLPTATS